MFKDTNSYGLVSLQFLCALGIFLGVDKSIPKIAITELYINLSDETLSGARDLDFQAISELVLEVNFQIKCSTLLNRRRKEENNESNLQIKEERDFFERSDQFEEELVEDLFKPLEHKEIEHPYVELQVQDAETIEIETKKEDNEFFDLKQKFNAVDNTATEQIKQNDLIDLVHDMLDENNPFNNKVKAEDIYIETNLCGDTDSYKTKKSF